MATYPIDLGRSGMGAEVAMSSPAEKHYPTLYLEWDEKYDLPDSGTMTVKFKKNSETNTKRKGEEHQTVSLDILEITSVKGKKSSPAEEDAGDILDRLKNDVENSREDSQEPGEEY